MYPAQFDYHTPGSIKEALDLLGKHKDDAKLLAGGHSLLPAMKFRLARPAHIVDLRKVPGLSGVKEDGGTNVRVVQSSGSIFWYLLMPITFIVHPAVTSVSADAEFEGPAAPAKKPPPRTRA